jgi:hypothetical protein
MRYNEQSTSPVVLFSAQDLTRAERVRHPHAAIAEIVSDWVAAYKKDQVKATRDLVNFVIHVLLSSFAT